MKHNKEEIIDKGVELMRNEGYHAVGVKDIVEAYGMPKGSFYNFFKSKDEFVGLVIDRYNEIALQQIISDLAGNESPLNKIKKHFTNLTFYYEKKACAEGCLYVNLSSEIGASHPILAEKIEKHYQAWMKLLAKEIEKGQTQGEIIQEIDAWTLANNLYNSFNGAVTRMKVQKNAQAIWDFIEINLKLIKV